MNCLLYTPGITSLSVQHKFSYPLLQSQQKKNNNQINHTDSGRFCLQIIKESNKQPVVIYILETQTADHL